MSGEFFAAARNDNPNCTTCDDRADSFARARSEEEEAFLLLRSYLTRCDRRLGFRGLGLDLDETGLGTGRDGRFGISRNRFVVEHPGRLIIRALVEVNRPSAFCSPPA